MRTITAHGLKFDLKDSVTATQLHTVFIIARLTQESNTAIDLARRLILNGQHAEARRLTEKATRRQCRAARLKQELKDVLA